MQTPYARGAMQARPSVVLDGTHFAAVMRLGFRGLVSLLSAAPLGAQERVVSGQVRDADTERPIESAYIVLVGVNRATLTGEDGGFRLTVPPGEARLSVSLIGYKRREIAVPPSAQELEVALERDVLGMEELVVIGRATETDRRHLPNSVATLDAEQVSRVPTQTVDQALIGKVAGANIQRHNGAPGGGLSVELRGVTSIIGDSRPLYVVDGVIVSNEEIPSGVGNLIFSGPEESNSPNRIADLNPEDIENIEILKGPSAAAIYGSKASNGVILITTKRGNARPGRPQIRLEIELGMPDLANTLGIRRFETLEEAQAVFGPEAAEFWDADRLFDHEHELAGRNPLNYELSGSVSGGSAATRFFASGTLKDEEGVVIGTGYAKRTVRLNLDRSFGRLVDVSLSTAGLFTDTDRGFTNNDNRGVSYWMALPSTPSFFDLRRRPDGSFPRNPFGGSNILETAHEATNEEEVRRLIASGQVTIHPVSTASHELRLRVDGGVDLFQQMNRVFAAPELQFEQFLGLPGTSVNGDANSEFMNLGGSVVHTWAPAGGDFSVTTSLGAQFERRELAQLTLTDRNLAGGPSDVISETDEFGLQTEDFGVYLQEDLRVGERLLISAGIRGDQSSDNVDPDALHWYPKAAVSYRFLSLPGFLEEAKVRFAFGQSGNQPRFGQKLQFLQVGSLGGRPTFRLPETVVDPDLGPERQTEVEAGADLTLFGDRARLEVTGFQTTITDMLLEQNLPGSTGFGVRFFNGGAMRQRGIEALLRAVPVRTRKTEFSADLTFALTRGEVTELPVPPFLAPAHFSGIGTFLIQEGESPTAIAGAYTLPDGSVDPLAIVGDTRPDFVLGLSHELRIGDIRVFALWDWKQGQDVVNLTGWLMDLTGNAADFDDPCAEPACLPGETLGEMRLRLFPNRVARARIEDASFLKLREVALSWDLPPDVTGLLSNTIRSARLTASARDLLTFTGYSGLDPEVSNFGTQSVSRGQDVAPYPPSRSVWLTLSVVF